MSAKKLTPAQLVAHRFGGGRALSRLLGRSKFSVGQWQRRGGRIPNQDDLHHQLLALAKAHKVKLTAEEIVNGGVP